MIKFERHWCMPNHETFKIKPFKNLIQEELGNKYLDPFPYPFEKDAIKYMKSFGDRSVDKIVFDPPYSQRQLKEMYKNAGQSFNHPMNSVVKRKSLELQKKTPRLFPLVGILME